MTRDRAPPARISEIDTAILAGGLGTRVAHCLGDLPKALAPVGGRPILDHLLDRIHGADLRRVVLCLGHAAAAILAHLRQSVPRDLRILYSVEPEPRGTAGALAHALPLLTSDPVLVLNGDTLADLDFGAFLAAYRAGEGGAAVACARMEGDRYGRVEIGADGRVARFCEKDAGAGPGWSNAGAYLLGRGMLATIAALGRGSLEHDILEHQQPGTVLAFRTAGSFVDIGTPETLAAVAKGGVDALVASARGCRSASSR
jgi:mannose-1-phosphate guanylyltransferase